MAFTTTDLENVEAAIVALAEGKRSVQVDRAGKTVSYQAANLDKLLLLRGVMQRELGVVPRRAYAKNGGRC